MNRFSAFATHFGISLLIFAVLAYLLVFVWYPDFFFDTDGGWQGMRIIVAVDLVLGPLLTFVVFKPGKPGLKRDLATIATFQFVCLVAGVWVVYAARPVALVYVDGYFYSVSQRELEQTGHVVPDLVRPSPGWVMVEIPQDYGAQSQLRRQAVEDGVALRFMTERYVPFDPEVAFESWQPPEIDLDDIDNAASVENFLAASGDSLDAYRLVPYGARYAFYHLAFRRDDNSFAGVVEAEPI